MNILRILLKITLWTVGIIIGLIVILLLLTFVIPEWWHNSSLHKVIDGADKITIMTIGEYDSSLGHTDAKIIAELTIPEKVKEFIEHLTVKPRKIFGISKSHACYGDYDFVFYKNGLVITTVNIGHGSQLRWNGWHSDYDITKECQEYLEELFAKFGYKLDPHYH